MVKKLSYCDFCRHKTASGCGSIPNYYNCKEAKDEFYKWLSMKKKKINKTS